MPRPSFPTRTDLPSMDGSKANGPTHLHYNSQSLYLHMGVSEYSSSGPKDSVHPLRDILHRGLDPLDRDNRRQRMRLVQLLLGNNLLQPHSSKLYLSHHSLVSSKSCSLYQLTGPSLHRTLGTPKRGIGTVCHMSSPLNIAIFSSLDICPRT